MGKTGATGLRRIINAFGYSMKGLRAAFKYESAFRQETALLIILLPLAILLGQTVVDYSILIGSLLLVMMVELLNSAPVFIALLNVIVIWSMYGYQFFMNQ